MDDSHAKEEGDSSESNGFVLLEELLGTDKTAGNAQENDGGTEEKCSGGGDEYNVMVPLVNGCHARQPPQRDERGVRGRPLELAGSIALVVKASRSDVDHYLAPHVVAEDPMLAQSVDKAME
ncbi:hypothetical protein O1611_g4775 [Lasiodiplodia mahajangana]|uniref:Uncharacterized protein n=1 Tax=Lasiodiplodia mahajangana TaxID=1108764 RepID=A0ACC2JNC9_9PEZI|nr:hypothetical protein O1611_g4775 [Lasiodiplodia mahajangana]